MTRGKKVVMAAVAVAVAGLVAGLFFFGVDEENLEVYSYGEFKVASDVVADMSLVGQESRTKQFFFSERRVTAPYRLSLAFFSRPGGDAPTIQISEISVAYGTRAPQVLPKDKSQPSVEWSGAMGSLWVDIVGVVDRYADNRVTLKGVYVRPDGSKVPLGLACDFHRKPIHIFGPALFASIPE
jgi:hypothetical protein